MKKPELTYEEFCKLPFIYKFGFTYEWGACRVYRNEEHGLQKEYVTKRNRHDEWPGQQTSLFMDSDDREFKTSDQLYVAYMEKVCGIKGEA
jgi:hypothetical protein